ncbi:MAG: MgtC/SapB family protein [Lachnospiraceae bacterium]|nr:MgtC/SapB family protein [Lachnospiraceae bacterium]
MQAALEYLREFHFGSVVFRLLLATIAGGVVGYGRTQKRQNAGIRTYTLTSIGAALTILISMYEYEMLKGPWSEMTKLTELKFDGTRFSAQVINGIGFLAAGTIIAVSHQQVSGLTTAIGLFTSACLGIAAGSGFYECVFLAVVPIVITMEFMQPIEVIYKRKLRNITIHVEYNTLEDVNVIAGTILERGAQIFDLDIERMKKDGDKYPSAIVTVKLSKESPSHSGILSSLAELACVRSVQELIS